MRDRRTAGLAHEDAIVLDEVSWLDDRVLRLGRRLHLDEHLVREDLGEPVGVGQMASGERQRRRCAVSQTFRPTWWVIDVQDKRDGLVDVDLSTSLARALDDRLSELVEVAPATDRSE
jgi:hypothetical protein